MASAGIGLKKGKLGLSWLAATSFPISMRHGFCWHWFKERKIGPVVACRQFSHLFGNPNKAHHVLRNMVVPNFHEAWLLLALV
jgi:hypothetical protein